jgi:hypothetical protein
MDGGSTGFPSLTRERVWNKHLATMRRLSLPEP